MMNWSEFQREGLIDDIYIHSWIRGVYEKETFKKSREGVLVKLWKVAALISDQKSSWIQSSSSFSK